MKTNYMNAKQQLFAIALTIATVISLAWVRPNVTEKNTKTALQTKNKIQNAINNNALQNLLCNVNPLPSLNSAWVADTTKKKQKIKIVTIDSNGVKRESTTTKELPDHLKADLDLDSSLNFDFKFEGLSHLDSLKHLSIKIMEGPEFKAMMRSNAELMKSPEWKKMMEDQAAAVKQYSVALKKQMESPEWKKQQAELMEYANEVAKSFNTAEMKKEAEAFKQLQNLEEYRKLKEKFEKDVEQLKKKQGIK